jgi:hypothetical protein
MENTEMKSGPKSAARATAGDPSLSAIGDVLTKILFGLSVMILACSPTGRIAAAPKGHNFQICSGYFALCAASTCQPTGRTIIVNVTDDATAPFPEADRSENR